MIDIMDAYYDDDEGVMFEKFAAKKRAAKVDKRTKHDLINEKRRERAAEKEEAATSEIGMFLV